jgi:hypothetical protein
LTPRPQLENAPAAALLSNDVARSGHGPGRSEMEQLIEAALAHATFLRQSALTGDDYGARATEAEAERWDGSPKRAE